jgi:protein-tyrosine phosphatase
LDNFDIYEVSVAGGGLGLSPVLGRGGHYKNDLAVLARWKPAVVVTMTTWPELERIGAAGLPDDLKRMGIDWLHLPIEDFGAPTDDILQVWAAHSTVLRAHLAHDRRVLVHCFGGCGRSGMVVLRLMVDAGENPADALARLRAVRGCAIETDAQMAWAKGG